jgi:hypothetical protein
MASDPSWYDAPPLLQIAASQQGGARGAQAWGVTDAYALITNFQLTPGGAWSGWQPFNLGLTAKVLQVAACQQNDGCCQLWITDSDQQLWSIWQTSPGGDWSGWDGPRWNKAPLLSQLACAQQGGSRGAQLWGTTDQDMLISCYQETPGGNWSAWMPGSWLSAPPTLDVAACQQNDGRVQIWILDQKMQLWSAWQTSPGGDWVAFTGPNWNSAPQLQSIAAAQQGGARGGQFWGIDQNNALWSSYQETPGGNWSGWIGPNWSGAPAFNQLAAAQQNNGCVQLWGIDQNLAVKTITQTSPGGNWSGWSP